MGTHDIDQLTDAIRSLSSDWGHLTMLGKVEDKERLEGTPQVKNCKFCSCRYQNVCGNTSLVCVILQYVAIIGVLAWAAYLFFNTAA